MFKQSGYTNKDKPQIDLILVVDDLKKWHLENMKLNSKIIKRHGVVRVICVDPKHKQRQG